MRQRRTGVDGDRS